MHAPPILTDIPVILVAGVVRLPFTIGIEFSLAKLLEARRSVRVAGPVQRLGTLAVETRGRRRATSSGVRP